jgi:competence protein ComFC
MERLTKFLLMFWDALFPRSCVVCKEEGSLLCKTCAEQVHIPAWSVHQTEEGIQIFSRISYKERAVQKILHAWKYQGDSSAGEQWKTWITEGEIPETWRKITCVPVPLAREAYAERGFNQAEELAKVLAIKCDGRCLTLLERFPTKAQAKTNKHERQEVRNGQVYDVSKHAKELQNKGGLPERVLLIDDVTTTGSTLLACAEELQRLGVREVFACTLAYGNAT